MERHTGEPCAVKAASTVRRGAVGKVPKGNSLAAYPTKRQQAIIDSELHKRLSLGGNHLVNQIARITDDRWDNAHPLEVTLENLHYITQLEKRTIRRLLTDCDEERILLVSRFERVRKPKYHITIIDSAYLDALDAAPYKKAAKKTQRRDHSPKSGSEIPSHSRPKGFDLKGCSSYKEPTAGNDEESAPRDNQKVNGSTNAKRINLELRSAIIEQQNIIHPATPPHEKEEARRELRRLTRSQNATPQDTAGDAYADAAAVGGSDDDEGEAAAVRPQPDPRLKERLRQLLADKPVQENNRIVLELQGRINALKAEQLTTAETQDRIDQLIADRIAVLEAEEEPLQDTAGTATLSPPSLGGSDDGQLDAAPDTTDTPGPGRRARTETNADQALTTPAPKPSKVPIRQYMGPRVQQPPPERNRFPARQGPIGPGGSWRPVGRLFPGGERRPQRHNDLVGTACTTFSSLTGCRRFCRKPINLLGRRLVRIVDDSHSQRG